MSSYHFSRFNAARSAAGSDATGGVGVVVDVGVIVGVAVAVAVGVDVTVHDAHGVGPGSTTTWTLRTKGGWYPSSMVSVLV